MMCFRLKLLSNCSTPFYFDVTLSWWRASVIWLVVFYHIKKNTPCTYTSWFFRRLIWEFWQIWQKTAGSSRQVYFHLADSSFSWFCIPEFIISKQNRTCQNIWLVVFIWASTSYCEKIYSDEFDIAWFRKRRYFASNKRQITTRQCQSVVATILQWSIRNVFRRRHACESLPQIEDYCITNFIIFRN